MSYEGYMKYEQNKCGLSQKRIEKLAALGYDVLYIQTGHRNVGPSVAGPAMLAEERAPYSPGAPDHPVLADIRADVKECKERSARAERILNDMKEAFEGRISQVLDRLDAERTSSRGPLRRDSSVPVARRKPG
jgi:hypothetical protein